MRRFFFLSCVALALSVLAPFVVRAGFPGAFRTAFFVMGIGAPFVYCCILVSGIALPQPASFFEMPLFRAGTGIALSPVALWLAVALASKWIANYSGGPQGMDQLVRYLAVVLVPGGLFACAAALTVFVILQRRLRTQSHGDS